MLLIIEHLIENHLLTHWTIHMITLIHKVCMKVVFVLFRGFLQIDLMKMILTGHTHPSLKPVAEDIEIQY